MSFESEENDFLRFAVARLRDAIGPAEDDVWTAILDEWREVNGEDPSGY